MNMTPDFSGNGKQESKAQAALDNMDELLSDKLIPVAMALMQDKHLRAPMSEVLRKLQEAHLWLQPVHQMQLLEDEKPSIVIPNLRLKKPGKLRR
jgi:hypothetical protein